MLDQLWLAQLSFVPEQPLGRNDIHIAKTRHRYPWLKVQVEVVWIHLVGLDYACRGETYL